MEEKKLDLNTVIGYILIFGILLYMLWQNQPTPEEIAAQEKQKEEQLAAESKSKDDQKTLDVSDEINDIVNTSDSLKLLSLQNKLGVFAYAATLPSAIDNETLVETDVFDLKFRNKGGYLSEVKLKDDKGAFFTDFRGENVFIIKDNNSVLDLTLNTSDNRTLHTKNLFFQPDITERNGNTVVSMRLKVSEGEFLEYRYEINPKDYMIGFSVKSQGLENILDDSQPIDLEWSMKTLRHAKSISYENRYTELIYEYDGDKDSYLGQQEKTEDVIDDVSYVAFKQHFFTSVLLSDSAFKTANLKSENLVQDEAVDTAFTKAFQAKLPIAFSSGELNKTMDLYFGPSDYKTLKAYDRNLDEIVPLGWGIFGWINRFVFIPLFGFLSGFLPYGFAIIVMTILVRLVMSPVTYKSYVSQAKMKVIKPELNALNEKYKDNAMKRQQETMALQSKAGVSPLKGCLPALLQLPVFYALFQFFPSAFDLRQKSFLWAEDLSSYDTIFKLPFNIPFYGDHVSLFPILASIAIFIYMQMTTGQNMAAQAPVQEGMPDMTKMMKYMLYFSPLMMLVFFNNYASGLSLYYFVSNTITIGIMLVIKHVIIDDEKIHAQIEANKKKPKKQGRFQKKMQEIMEQAEQQKRAQQKRK